jgi:hypothetical protein
MTDIHTILLSELNRTLAGSELAKDIDDALIERIRVAKRSYQSIPHGQLRFDVEEKRSQLLNEISMLQSETFFKVGHSATLSRMIPNILIPYLIDQGAAAYEARSEQDLNVLELNLTHFRGLLDQAVDGRAKRGTARGYGIFGTIAALFTTGGLVAYGAGAGLDKNWVIPILSIPVTVILWSFIGSLAAMLYRFNQSSDTEMSNPLRWLFTRPLTGMVMGLLVYLFIKGALIVTGSTISFLTLGSQEVIWLLAFFAGFSDRFCDFVLNLIVGRLGGLAMESKAEPAQAQTGRGHSPTHRTFEMLEELAWARRQAMDATASPEPYPDAYMAPAKAVDRKGDGTSKNGKDA